MAMAMPRFTPDNTSGYSADDLKVLNAAWNSLPCVVLNEDADIAAQSMLDHISEELLHAYDQGRRGEALLAFYYDEEGGI